MSEELLQMIGVVLLYIGLVLLGNASEPEETGGGIKPITRDLKPITPLTPPPPPSPRTPVDEVNPPRIPTKRTR